MPPRTGRMGVTIVVLSAFCAGSTVAQDGEHDWSTARTLYPGILYTRTDTAEPRPLVLHVVRIDTGTPGLAFHTTRRRAEWMAGQAETDRQTTTDFLRQARRDGVNIVVAVNADAFSPWPAPFDQATPTDLLGLAVSAGELVSHASGTPSLLLDRSGDLRIARTDTDTDLSDVTTAVSGFAHCLIDGEAQPSGADRHPRTGLGLSQDARYLLVAAIDGRQPTSWGATTEELGRWLKHFGAWNAINMDGGGSTTLTWWDPDADDDDKSRLLNSPVGDGRNRMLQAAVSFAPSERANGNNLGVVFSTVPPSADQARPRLSIINGSDQSIEIHWLASPTERVSQGSLAPGEHRVIDTTLGHRFAIVGSDDDTETTVVSRVPVQAVRFVGACTTGQHDGSALDDVPAGKVIAPPAGLGIPAFYQKFISASGYPIVASQQVHDYALREAAYLVDLMLAHRPDVRTAMIQSGSRLCILAHNEFTTDLPEFAHFEPPPGVADLSGKEYWDARARGTGGSDSDPYCSCGEENLLGYAGDPYATENILIHEFAHNIHLRGLVNVDPTFDRRLRETHQQALAAGLWQGTYAAVNHAEYFAEGVQSWFDTNREHDHDHNHVNTRAELVEYDPALAAICREVFGDGVPVYTKPMTRLRDHLAGYDPASAPTFAWPPRLERAHAVMRQAVREAESVSEQTGTGDAP